MLLKDFEKSEAINHFSQESKDLITEMGNNEIFVFYDFFEETMSVCALYWEIGINGCESTIQPRQIWLVVDSWIRNQEEPIPRSLAWSIHASNNVSQST